MSVTLPSYRLAPGDVAVAWRGVATVSAGLAAVVGARWLAVRAGEDGLVVGAVFGLALLGLAVAGGLVRRRSIAPRAVIRRWSASALVGVLVGLALVLVAAIGPSVAGGGALPGLGRPAAPFLPWASITVLVASAEEVVLRGVLFRQVQRASGLALAVALTSVAFALLHVPLYGWHVVPLDLAVGLVLGGLRVATRTVAAPAAAHVVADLATWWL